jgi:hypothetical protein
MDWIGLAQTMDQWRAVVNPTINLQFPETFGISRVTERLATSQEMLSNTELVNI